MYHIIQTRKHGIEIWALIFNGQLLGTFFSKDYAEYAKQKHEHKIHNRSQTWARS